MRHWIGLAIAWVVLGASADGRAGDPGPFRDRVAPILRGHCLRCHQGTKPAGEIDLSQASGVLEGRGDGWVVVPGQPEASRLFEVIAADPPEMPRAGDRLDPGQVETIRAWIAAGATWPDGEVLKLDPLDWWSLRPLVAPKVPDADAGWARTPIDAFVLQGLRSRGLAPSPEADRRTLIRRVTFDLTGLPPGPGEVARFEADTAPDAWERLVDRLLASPRYGERWARHWLDVARYGDTHGYDKDQPRPNAWPYRDYVVRAFNEDKPYARFVARAGGRRRPLPGDPRTGRRRWGSSPPAPGTSSAMPRSPRPSSTARSPGCSTATTWSSNTLNSFASLTVQCARCHDHKFDPVPQEDYYRLQAVFAALDRAERPYDADPAVARTRLELGSEPSRLDPGDRVDPGPPQKPESASPWPTWSAGSRASNEPPRLGGRSPTATTRRSRPRPTPPGQVGPDRPRPGSSPIARVVLHAAATTTSTRSAPASGSRRGSGSRRRTIPGLRDRGRGRRRPVARRFRQPPARAGCHRSRRPDRAGTSGSRPPGSPLARTTYHLALAELEI